MREHFIVTIADIQQATDFGLYRLRGLFTEAPPSIAALTRDRGAAPRQFRLSDVLPRLRRHRRWSIDLEVALINFLKAKDIEMFDKTPYERGVEMLETLSSTQRERTEAAITRLRIEWAKLYGDRLPPLLSDHLSVVAALHPQIIDAGHGIGPQSDAVFREIAKEIVEAEPMVQRALDSADEKMKAEIRAEKYGELPPTKRMEMARAKSLDAFLDSAVREELEARHAMRG